jgi:hypothetical protein
MAFGNGFKHEEMSEMLEAGNYEAKIKSAELKKGNYGDYIQVEVDVKDHPNCNPHIFLLNDMPQSGFGSMTLEQAQGMWNKKMTAFFASFKITEGDFEVSHWVGKTGEITVQQQRKNPQYNEIVPYKTKPRKAAEKKETATHTDTNNADAFPEDVPDIF